MAQSRTKRAQLQAQQQKKAAKAKRNRTIAVAGILVVALALVGVVVWQSQSPVAPVTPSGTTDSTSPSSGDTASTTPSSPGIFIPPNGTAAMGYIEIKSPNVAANALVVDEHLDYQCPFCHLLDSIMGPSFRGLAERGDIILRIHIRSFLDGTLHNDSSSRAAMAATCADTTGDFMSYHETIFANQPAQEGTGYTDDQLRVEFPAMAGITGDDLTAFQTCYDTQQTSAYVQQMEMVNSTSKTINGATQNPPTGTPAMYVNGTPLLFNQLIGVDSSGKTYVAKVDTSLDGFLAYLKTVPSK